MASGRLNCDIQVFPGGVLPTLTLLLQTLQQGSSGRLIVDSVSNIGPHYARTLREWRRRFLHQFESVIVPALKREYPEVMGGPTGRQEIEVFKRKWICMSFNSTIDQMLIYSAIHRLLVSVYEFAIFAADTPQLLLRSRLHYPHAGR